MIIYLDKDFRCHLDDGDGQYRAWEDTGGFFSGKCRAFIEGYRVVPEGETWTREDGAGFVGLMIAPAFNYGILQVEQARYEEALRIEPPTPEPLALGEAPPAPSIPDWQQPTKASEAYSIGAVVRYQGDLYQSTVYVNMRPPGEIPGQWGLVEGED